ncbi:MAG: hypothetical protein DI535_24865 [Citrobacter freundii]|nr:MAG: hypothetical protein DI535_24865 [Citrobacter freundii]
MNCGVIITFSTGQLTQHSGPSSAAPEDFEQEPLVDFFAQQTDMPETFTPCSLFPAFRKNGSATNSTQSISRKKNDMADLFIKAISDNSKI